MIAEVRRDVAKASRVPADLAAEMAEAAALGEHAWLEARAANDYGRFRDALERQIDLRHRYAACFPEAAHPYDVLLDDFEPGFTQAELAPLLEELRAGLVELVRSARTDAYDAPLAGTYPAAAQRAFVLGLLEAHGFDAAAWRLDPTVHPFAQRIGQGDIRITTRYDESDLDMALFSSLHEFGHGLYEAGIDPELARTVLGHTTSLGIHESQSRMWENVIGRSRAFATWLAPRLAEAFPELRGLQPDRLFAATTAVRPSLIRIQADETTYNLHVVLRADLERRLFAGELDPAALPEAWDAGVHELLGLEVPTMAEGVLQDIHWGAGLIGYFPTYTLGNLVSAQLWEAIRRELPDVEAGVARGDTTALREWLRDRIHRHGRTFPPRELLRRVTGEELQVQPFLRYLRDKLTAAGHLAPEAA
jgi:carboxypeptidase Taq